MLELWLWKLEYTKIQGVTFIEHTDVTAKCSELSQRGVFQQDTQTSSKLS